MIWDFKNNWWNVNGLIDLHNSNFDHNNNLMPQLYHEQIEIPENEFDGITELQNPKFIGYGNPRANILFVGHECGYEASEKPKKYLHEIILNSLHWADEIGGVNSLNLEDLSDTDADLNNEFYAHEIHRWVGGHNFGWYKRILGFDNDDNYNLFKEVFVTELHSSPKRFTKSQGLETSRETFLSEEPFFRKFQTVVLGGKSILKNSIVRGNTRHFSLFGFDFSVNKSGTCFCANNLEQFYTLGRVQYYDFIGQDGNTRRLIVTGNLSNQGQYHPNVGDLRSILTKQNYMHNYLFCELSHNDLTDQLEGFARGHHRKMLGIPQFTAATIAPRIYPLPDCNDYIVVCFTVAQRPIICKISLHGVNGRRLPLHENGQITEEFTFFVNQGLVEHLRELYNNRIEELLQGGEYVSFFINSIDNELVSNKIAFRTR